MCRFARILECGLRVSSRPDSPFPLLLLHGRRARTRAVADHLGGADDRRLPGAADWPRLRHDFRQPEAARRFALSDSRPRAGGSRVGPANARARPHGSQMSAADPTSTSVIVPALNEDAIADVVSALRGAGAWHEIIVVDDGSTDGTGERAAAAGAIVVRHPYNKGNGAAVKSGIRRATGDNVLIVDGDGQHRPADSARLVSHLSEYDLVVGARST